MIIYFPGSQGRPSLGLWSLAIAGRNVICFDWSLALFREPSNDHYIGMPPFLPRLLVAALLCLCWPVHTAVAATREGAHASDVQTVPRGVPMLAP